jgi:hypothetical protein
MSHSYDLEKPGTCGAPNRILRVIEKELPKPHKIGTVPEKRDKLNTCKCDTFTRKLDYNRIPRIL